MPSKIEWTDETWNPVTGCTKISEGCRNCYAERMAKRLAGRYGYPADEPFRVTLHPDRLEQPLRWRKPRMVFVCSMSDLFHEDVPVSYIDSIFALMALCPQHTFQVLTKRAERMTTYLEHNKREIEYVWLVNALRRCIDVKSREIPWPISNVWLGVTAENQRAANERIPLLLQTPAAVRFVSCEPLLEAVMVKPYLTENKPRRWYRGIDWVIAGGESGPGARPMHPDWARSLRDQATAAGVPFFFKQVGEWRAISGKNPQEIIEFQKHLACQIDGSPLVLWRVGKKTAGRLLDGREWNEFPEVP